MKKRLSIGWLWISTEIDLYNCLSMTHRIHNLIKLKMKSNMSGTIIWQESSYKPNGTNNKKE